MTGLLFLASVACLLVAAMWLGRSVPAQNAVFIVLCLAGVEAGAEFLCGARHWKEGELFWPAAIILMRAGAQAVLKPARRNRNYGLYLTGLAGGGAALLQTVIAPGMAAVGRFFLTVACLVFLMPWFLRKRVTISEAAKE